MSDHSPCMWLNSLSSQNLSFSPYPLHTHVRVMILLSNSVLQIEVKNCFTSILPCVCACMLSGVWLFVTPWTGAGQAPLSMEFSRQDNWSGLPFSTPGDLPNPGIEPMSPALTGGFFTIAPPAAAAAKSLQLCLTLYDPIDSSPSGSPVPGILQARTLEWVAISFSNAWKWKVKVKSLSRVWVLATPWTAAYQAPPSMRFSRREYWSGVPLHHLGSAKSLGAPSNAQVSISRFFLNYSQSDKHHYLTMLRL